MPTQTIQLIIPTYNAYRHLSNTPLLAELIRRYPTLIIDSSSGDLTLDYARSLGAEVISIPKTEFNHGATREYARHLAPSDIVVFLTQDAIPLSADLIEHLCAPLRQHTEVVVSYGRQLPRDHADIFEAFPRTFNYANEPQIRDITDTAKYGVYTFFCSNSCAAYKNSALDRIGGFKRVLTNEDYFAVADLLQQGFKVAYVPEAMVKHSHAYTLWQEFQRYFDTGLVRAEYPIIQKLVGHAEKRGADMMRQLLTQLYHEQPHLIPYAILQAAVKWLGFRIGFYGRFLPLFVRKGLSQQLR